MRAPRGPVQNPAIHEAGHGSGAIQPAAAAHVRHDRPARSPEGTRAPPRSNSRAKAAAGHAQADGGPTAGALVLAARAAPPNLSFVCEKAPRALFPSRGGPRKAPGRPLGEPRRRIPAWARLRAAPAVSCGPAVFGHTWGVGRRAAGSARRRRQHNARRIVCPYGAAAAAHAPPRGGHCGSNAIWPRASGQHVPTSRRAGRLRLRWRLQRAGPVHDAARPALQHRPAAGVYLAARGFSASRQRVLRRSQTTLVPRPAPYTPYGLVGLRFVFDSTLLP